MFEAVPNVSEGRDQATIEEMSSAIRRTDGVRLLNVSSDEDHNRTVFTFVSDDASGIEEASVALFNIAVRRIDLRTHRGAHPRTGAVDVLPFVPLDDTTMDECVGLAVKVGRRVADRFGIPVYLYEYAARAETRRDLPAIRSGQFEKFAEKIADPAWAPDFGPSEIHTTSGIAIIGARDPLIAFNVQLATNRLEVAATIARAVRESSGGLRYVRALPIFLEHRGVVQVSMNLLDYRRTPIHRAFELVKQEAARYGVQVLSSEIVGLVPMDALLATAEWNLQLENFSNKLVLEERIREESN